MGGVLTARPADRADAYQSLCVDPVSVAGAGLAKSSQGKRGDADAGG